MSNLGLESVLAKVAKGEIDLLIDEYIILPVSKKMRGPGKTEQISVPTIHLAGKKFVPAFTSEDLFSAWAEGRYNCLSLIGGDIAASVPGGSGLIINPGSATAIQISPETLLELAGHGPAPKEASAEDLNTQLRTLLKEHATVSEAYLAPVAAQANPQMAELLLGLLYHRVLPEDRFNLLSAIAQISSDHFGSAGAIEVYDDLHLKHSNSWELFQALTPFYILGEENRAESSPPLNAQVEKITAKNSENVAADRGRPIISRIFVRQ